MKIELRRLRLQNFKGARSLDLKFKKITNISGDNGTFKTTIFDAFLWLWFGKDSTDRKDFNIKTLDANNEPLHKLDHEVEAEYLIDGRPVLIRRLYQENWVNPKGSADRKLAGHVQSFFWNDVPLKLEQFQEKVAAIIPETLFKLITNTAFFNNLKWQDRRNTLLDLAGEITDRNVFDCLATEITGQNRHLFDALLKNLDAGKKIEEYQRELAVKKKKVKDELLLLPARIDEADRALPDEQDYEAIDEEIRRLTEVLDTVDCRLMDQTKAQTARQNTITAKVRQIGEHRNRMQTIEFEEKGKVKDRRHGREEKISEAKRQLRDKESELSSLVHQRGRLQLRKPQIETQQAEGRSAWTVINKEKLEFKEGQFCCPTCEQDLPANQVTEKKKLLTDNFNKDKARRLEENVSAGRALGVELAGINAKVGNIEEQEKALQEEIKRLRETVSDLDLANQGLVSTEALEVQRAIASNSEYNTLKGAIKTLEDEVNAPEEEATDKQQLVSRKRSLQADLQVQRDLAASKKTRETGEKRIEELKRQENELAASLSDMEGIDFAIQQFTKAKMDLLEERINGKFRLVKFKLFEQQINGGEAPCCETLVKGVPYSDVNTASKINAGLDIINTLCAHYGTYAPVFIDNAESVNTLQPVNSQLIRLVVTKDKKLKVESP